MREVGEEGEGSRWDYTPPPKGCLGPDDLEAWDGVLFLRGILGTGLLAAVRRAVDEGALDPEAGAAVEPRPGPSGITV